MDVIHGTSFIYDVYNLGFEIRDRSEVHFGIVCRFRQRLPLLHLLKHNLALLSSSRAWLLTFGCVEVVESLCHTPLAAAISRKTSGTYIVVGFPSLFAPLVVFVISQS